MLVHLPLPLIQSPVPGTGRQAPNPECKRPLWPSLVLQRCTLRALGSMLFHRSEIPKKATPSGSWTLHPVHVYIQIVSCIYICVCM